MNYNGIMAMRHLVHAANHLKQGKHYQAIRHLESASTHFKAHQDHLKAQGQHMESALDTKSFNEKFSGLASDIHAAMHKGEEQEEIEKAGSPYAFKPLGQLHPEDQEAAHAKFGGNAMEQHTYPTHPDTGRLAHAARKPMSSGAKPAGAQSSPKPPAAPKAPDKGAAIGQTKTGVDVHERGNVGEYGFKTPQEHEQAAEAHMAAAANHPSPQMQTLHADKARLHNAASMSMRAKSAKMTSQQQAPKMPAAQAMGNKTLFHPGLSGKIKPPGPSRG